MMNTLNSLQNPKIKNVVKLLQKKSARKEQGLFVIDGLREIEEAIKAKIEIQELFYCPELSSEQPPKINKEKIIEVPENVFKKICYKDNPDGFLAIAKRKDLTLTDIKLSKAPLIIILEAVEKPGNLGAIIRTACAIGVDAVIINDNQTDIYNPNVIRASEGKIFANQIVVVSRGETKKWLKQNNIKSFATTTDAEINYSEQNFKEAVAIVLGSEANGLSKEWIEQADEIIKIPMKEGIDSLNVSVSAAIIVFEAIRQRSIERSID